MFTGLVEGTAPVRGFERQGTGARLTLGTPSLGAGQARWKPVLGESIAVAGCCLSVVQCSGEGDTVFDLSSETLDLTWFHGLECGRELNVERSLRVGDRLGGHMVSGHVDGVGRVAGMEDGGDGGVLFAFQAPAGFERWLVEKGSVTVDGVSLTVVAPRERRFQVAVIPETLRRTSLGRARVGDAVHLEGDMVGKWVARLLERSE